MGAKTRTDQTPSTIRLNKYLAQVGVASRRKADELITLGKVIVNGKKITELGAKVDPTRDNITVRGKPVRRVTNFYYYMFNKPPRVLTTLNDPEGRPTIVDYIKHLKARVYPVGRLDWDSEGLILLTNDGEFAQRVTHPENEVPKTYWVKIRGTPSPADLAKLVRGVSIIGGKAYAESARKIEHMRDGKYQWLEIVISEGRNRQVRKMLEKIRCDVIKLQRVAIGRLKLGKLKKGRVRELEFTELDKVFLDAQTLT